jgi:hypothetical protein
MAKPKGTQRNPHAIQPQTADDGGIYVSGKLVIVVVLLLAFAGAGFSWWYRYSSTRESVRFWGGQNASLIRDAQLVHLITVGPMDPDHVHDPNAVYADHYHVPDGLVGVLERRDVTHAPGLVHLRRELLMDRNFESHNGVLASANDWQYGLEFRDAETSLPFVVFFTADCRRLLRYPSTIGPGVAKLEPTFAEGLKSVLDEWRTLDASSASAR